MPLRRFQSKEPATRWAVLIIPIILLGAFGFGTYAIIYHLCVQYLIRQRGETGLATAFLVLYAIFFPLTIAPYLRVLYTAQTNPGAVPWTDDRIREEEEKERNRHLKPKRSWWKKPKPEDAESRPWNPPDQNPDSPGLENFYSKNVFVCEGDGRPKWCSECRSWKPDRASHSSELGRCIRKMDHLCPWVGGMVSETSFNFFFQFTLWCLCYCIVCLACSAYCLTKQRQEPGGLDGVTVGAIALSAFFGFFSFGMTGTSANFVFQNKTNIDLLRKDHVHQLAVRVPRGTRSTSEYQTITYPLTQPSGWPAANAQMNADGQTSSDSSTATRDQQASRTFAILRTEPGENPWDLGYYGNFKVVMGNTLWEWILPIKHSPCCNHDSMDSDYKLGPLVEELATRVNLPRKRSKSDHTVEMTQTSIPDRSA
ncbi:palmitoyltransferase PFA5 [Sarocladium strictum]